MSGTTPTEEGNRSPSLGGRVEEMCDRFEAAWKAGRRPPIEDYLGEVPEARQPAFFRELLVLTYRDRAGDRPAPEEYSPRFPKHAELIAAVFSGTQTPARSQVGASPTRQTQSLQPEAIGAAAEVTKPPKPSRQQVSR
jgi:hypothetical protein